MINGLVVFVEGGDDERFIETIIKQRFMSQYVWVSIYKYANKKKRQVNNFINSLNAMGAKFIFVSDNNASPCISHKKSIISQRFTTIKSNEQLIVVIEIEGWYLAGLDDSAIKRIGMKSYKSTNALTKEDFNQFKPKKYDSRIDFMQEILKLFSIPQAKKRNKSFEYFITKYNL